MCAFCGFTMAEPTGIRFDPNASCENCGCFGAYGFDGKVLCLDCYEQHGSCCHEAGIRDEAVEREPVCRKADA
jgi:hypothetical protein